MSNSKILGFRVSEELANKIYEIIGWSENSPKSISECFVEFFEKLIVDKSLPTQQSTEELKVNDKEIRNLYDQYLKDTSEFDWSKIPKDQPKEPTENESKENPFEFARQNPCPYRTVVQEKGKFLVLCAEQDKIPLEACVTRQKRFLHMERKCKPLSYRPPIKRWQQRAQQEPRTKIYRGDSDYFNPSDDYFKDDWGATP
jgi:hypothetical protein